MGYYTIPGSRDNLLVRSPDSLSKGCEFESRQERQENFLLQSKLSVLTLIRCPFHPRVTAVARKRPRSFYQKCCDRLHINTHTSLTQQSQNGLTMPLSRHNGEPIRQRAHTQLVRKHSATVSQPAEPLWTNPGIKSGISVPDLISDSA